MDEKQTAKKNFKPMIIALSVLVVIVSAYFITSSVLGKGFFSKDVSGAQLYAEDEAADSQGIQAESETPSGSGEVVVTENETEKTAEEITEEGKDITKNLSTTFNHEKEYENNDGTVEGGASASRILSGAVATHRWTASNVISNVTAERIAVNLNVYSNGIKTDKTVRRYMYAAVINTKPSRIVVPAASQFSKRNLESMAKFVKAYESQTKEDILFAVNNEMCSRDYDNLHGNVFYNGNDTITGTVIKNSKVAQEGEVCNESLTINKDGTWKYPVKVSMSTANDLINRGTIASVSYTYPVIWGGKKYVHPESGENTGIWTNHYIAEDDEMLYDNRTIIGQVDSNKYIVLISEGFGYGYLAEYMLNDLGVQNAYWGNGGIAAAMYVKGHGLVTPNNYIVHGDLFCVK